MAKIIHETRKIIDEHEQEGFIMALNPIFPIQYYT